MNLASRSTRLLILAVAAALFLAVAAVAFFAYRMPTQKDRPVTRLTYDLSLDISHQPYGLPEAKLDPNPIYFTRLIQSIEASYAYRFAADAPLARVSSEAQVVAVVGGRSWQREVVLVPPTRKESDFTFTFALDPEALLQWASEVARQAGAESPNPEVTLKARVHTVAQVEQGLMQEDFEQSARVKIGPNAIEWERPLSRSGRGFFQGVSYQHWGEFGYAIQTKPSVLYDPASEGIPGPADTPTPVPTPLPNPLYFTRIVDAIEGVYSYRFLADTDPTSVTTQVLVEAAISGKGWQKRTVLFGPAELGGEFTVTFPFDPVGLMKTASDIAKETGADAPSNQVAVTAQVHVLAQTQTGIVEKDFVQATEVRVGANTLEMVRPLALTTPGESPGLRYEQRGRFSYSVRHKDNLLVGTVTLTPEAQAEPDPWWQGAPVSGPTLRSEPEAAPTPIPLKVAPSYLSSSLERIDLGYTYQMKANKPVRSASHSVQSEARLKSPNGTIQTFVLLPVTQKTDNFTLNAPLDMGLVRAAIAAAEKGGNPPSLFYDLEVKTDVRTTADTAEGPIAEVLSKTLSLRLEGGNWKWPEGRAETKSGSIKGVTKAPNALAKRARMGSLALLGIAALALLGAVWNYRWPLPLFQPRSQAAAEARQAKSKHKDILVEVAALPRLGEQEMEVRLESLAELVKVADALLKPVLHEERDGRHGYCVSDGLTRYVYQPPDEGYR